MSADPDPNAMPPAQPKQLHPFFHTRRKLTWRAQTFPCGQTSIDFLKSDGHPSRQSNGVEFQPLSKNLCVIQYPTIPSFRQIQSAWGKRKQVLELEMKACTSLLQSDLPKACQPLTRKVCQ